MSAELHFLVVLPTLGCASRPVVAVRGKDKPFTEDERIAETASRVPEIFV